MNETTRLMKANMPYKAMAVISIKRIVLHSVLLMSAFVDRQEIPYEYSPSEFILCWKLDWKQYFKYYFGAYGQAYDEPDPTTTNTQQPRSCNVICLGPAGNMQGSYYFLDIDTMATIKC